MTFDFMCSKSKLWQQSYQKHLNNTGVKGSIAVVITPLTALMLDQKERFIHTGLTVEFVGSVSYIITIFKSLNMFFMKKCIFLHLRVLN